MSTCWFYFDVTSNLIWCLNSCCTVDDSCCIRVRLASCTIKTSPECRRFHDLDLVELKRRNVVKKAKWSGNALRLVIQLATKLISIDYSNGDSGLWFCYCKDAQFNGDSSNRQPVMSVENKYDIPSINRQGIVPIQRIALDNEALCVAKKVQTPITLKRKPSEERYGGMKSLRNPKIAGNKR